MRHSGGEGDQQHRTVLLHEAVNALIWRADGVYVDGTFGRGGHSRLVLSRLEAKGRLVAFDKDPQAIAEAQRVVDSRFSLIHESFAEMGRALPAQGLSRVSGILLDLGVSSPQIDAAERGFSFRMDGPLDMRMDNSRGLTAAEWLARADEHEIVRVIRDYGEERFAVRIAKAIIARREQSAECGPLTRTAELAALVATAVKTREKGQNPATRTFQALRIFVNQELEDLTLGLNVALELLEPGGRLVVISFHSLEDRIVKRFMQAHAGHAPALIDSRTADVLRRLPARHQADARLRLLGRLRPSPDETGENPRARSAIMRVAEKIE